MILMMVTIHQEDEEKESVVIGFNAHDVEGTTKLEGDIADDFRKILIKAREDIMKKYEWTSTDVLANIYKRTFSNPDDRDKHAEGEK